VTRRAFKALKYTKRDEIFIHKIWNARGWNKRENMYYTMNNSELQNVLLIAVVLKLFNIAKLAKQQQDFRELTLCKSQTSTYK